MYAPNEDSVRVVVQGETSAGPLTCVWIDRRVYDLESNKVKVSGSVKLDERGVNDIYDAASTEGSVTIQMTKDGEDAALPEPAQQRATDNPMESVGETAEDSAMREAEHNK
ncbi:hypothetical protein ON010_g16177 [Phytophthora cinnamomi]|nr:hypothetical protein ON010_g16177 [Phytophthora cinnamomi]